MDSPELQRLSVPLLDLLTDDEDMCLALPDRAQESMVSRRSVRWRSGALHPPAGAVVELPVPNVSLEDL